MPNPTERVAIVASALSELRPAWDTAQHVDLISDTVNHALLGTSLGVRDIGFVINCGSDVLDGRSISNCGFLGAMGAHHKEESRVEEDGLFGAMYAVSKSLATGKVGVVLAYSKPSESIVENYYSTIAEPFYQRPVGLNKAVASGLLASQYLHETGATDEDLARIASRAWTAAASNPKVADAAPRSVEDVLAGRLVADPLRELALSRPLDGAVAVIVAPGRIAKKLTPTPVWVTGMGSAMESQFLSERTPGKLDAAEAAASAAIRRSGRRETSGFDLAEVSASSAAEEAMVIEALGLAPRGGGAAAYDGDIAINPSGGALPADPIIATGLVRLHEAAERLIGALPGPSAGSAIVHGSGGIGAQTHSVFTLEV